MSIPVYHGAAAAAAVIMSHELRKKKIIFVESIYDSRLIDSIFGDFTFYSLSAIGVQGVIDALTSIEHYNASQKTPIYVLGFVDKDYLLFCDKNDILKNEKIITTDYRDIEIDLLHTKTLKRFLEEKASQSKWSKESDVVSEILNNLLELSFLRVYNAIFEKNWSFKAVDLQKYTDTLGIINYSKLINAFKQNNQLKESDWNAYTAWRKVEDFPLKHIARGHDATCVLGQMLRKKLGNRKTEESYYEVVEENLRLSTQTSYLDSLEWFKRIQAWLSIPI